MANYPKISDNWIIQAILFAWFMLVQPLVVGAFVPFADNFESYSIGSITGQGDWATGSTGCVVSTYVAHGGTNSMLCHGKASYKLGDPSDSSMEWSFYVKGLLPDRNQDLRITLRDSDGTTINTISFIPVSGHAYCGNGVNRDLGDISNDYWYKFSFKWDKDLQTTDCAMDDIWTGDFSAPAGFDNGIDQLSFVEQNNKDIYIDDISGTTSPSDSISITDPADNSTALVNGVTVQYSIDAANAGFDRAEVWLCGGDVTACESLCTNGYVPAYSANCWVSSISVDSCDSEDSWFAHSVTLNPSVSFAEGDLINMKAYLLVSDPANGNCVLDTIEPVSSSDDLHATSDEVNVQYSISGAPQNVDDYCDSGIEIFDAVCTMFYNIFIPERSFSQTLQFMAAQLDSIMSSRIPFCYFSDYKAVLTDLGTGSDPAGSMGDFTVPVVVAASSGFSGASSAGFLVSMPDIDDVDTAAAAYDDWDEMFSYIIWLGLFGWLCFRGFSIFKPV